MAVAGLKRAPRVLVLGAVLGQPMGGVRRHNAEILPRAARLLAERGGALAVLAGREPPAFDLPGVEVLPGSTPARPVVLRAALEARECARALREAERAGRPFDLVHTAHLPPPDCQVPLTVLAHDLRGLDPRVSTMPRRLAARTAYARARRRAALWMVVSEAVGRDIADLLAVPPERIHLVGNGGDHFAPLPRAAAAGAPILVVGHVERRKNLEVVLRALAVDPALPRLVVHGAAKDGEDQRLSALARQLGVDGRVEWRGVAAESELPGLHAAAGVVCVPSFVEGFSLVALEAQLAEAPLCVADIPALAEIAPLAGRFAPEDAEACARALRAELARPPRDLREARRRAAPRTWDACAERLVEGWTRAVAPGPA
jgi:glycosyltransferase involved in cell wall biosynthesis